MKCHVVFKHLDYSKSLEEYANQKLEKLIKFEWKPVNIHLTLSRCKHQIAADLHAIGAEAAFQAQVKGENFYTVVDQVILKLLNQISKKKNKIKEHKKKCKSNSKSNISITQQHKYDESSYLDDSLEIESLELKSSYSEEKDTKDTKEELDNSNLESFKKVA